ncbi:hypothetical protein I7I50_05926 [Histoplasma capsulatum G186AR]|uniref:Uncharacterized protein n=1 Tax=Ajellomyces capsulatus TaxID=5037 RepID=A0A8H7ZD21_AJECA|nr:hypothetical protein I7I52_04185 [Histoplasma capsulatum]QSS76465.1 hypothetical protein I7I50_05926 [Histoplasma capsulatum G186AR]
MAAKSFMCVDTGASQVWSGPGQIMHASSTIVQTTGCATGDGLCQLFACWVADARPVNDTLSLASPQWAQP